MAGNTERASERRASLTFIFFSSSVAEDPPRFSFAGSG
jgi:hypothetical protein